MTRGHSIASTPDSLRDFARKRVTELAGLLLLLSCGALALALATWSTRDPSISHATDSSVRNWLGSPGAVVADLIMQTVGVGAAPALLPLAALGLRLVGRRRIDRLFWRLLLWIVGVCCAATSAAMLPVTDRWPLPTGLGGVVGDALFALGGRVIAGPIGSVVVGLAAVFGAILCLSGAAGVGFSAASEDPSDLAEGTTGSRRSEEYDEEDSAGEPSAALVWLGALLHYASAVDVGLRRGLEERRAAWTRSREPNFEPSPPPFEARYEPVFDLEARDDRAQRDQREQSSRCETPFPSAVDEPELALSRPSAPPVQPSAPPSQKAKIPAKARARIYAPPSLELLSEAKKLPGAAKLSPQALSVNAQELEGVLEDFAVRGSIVNVRPGPVVTLYELEPAPGVKSSRVISLADDIARSMSAVSARVAVVSGRNAIGIELPNQQRETVYLRELLACSEFGETKHKLAIALGKTIGGEPIVVDLARMPHLLVAGTTGSGKSVAINTMILSLLYRLKPEECQLILVDPKMLELSVYDNIPHLLTPVVTDPKKAVVALKWAVREMEDRYRKMSKVGVRNIDGFNTRVLEARASGEVLTRSVQTGFDPETGEAIYESEEMDLAPLPYIVVIVDEMADLMLVAGKDIEGAIQRLAQMARAAGIHLIMATQRPSVDVITGTIKANFPTRISFQVTSKIDSRTILSEMGAEQLLGQGDMLYMAGGGRISRVHGPFVSDAEVEKVVAHLRAQGQPAYLEAITMDEDLDDEGGPPPGPMDAEEGGDLYGRAVAIVLRDKKCSTSYIQRRLSVGYNKAASLVEQMEQQGVVSPPNHSGKREILIGGGADRGMLDIEAAE